MQCCKMHSTLSHVSNSFCELGPLNLVDPQPATKGCLLTKFPLMTLEARLLPESGNKGKQIGDTAKEKETV